MSVWKPEMQRRRQRSGRWEAHPSIKQTSPGSLPVPTAPSRRAGAPGRNRLLSASRWAWLSCGAKRPLFLSGGDSSMCSLLMRMLAVCRWPVFTPCGHLGTRSAGADWHMRGEGPWWRIRPTLRLLPSRDTGLSSEQVMGSLPTSEWVGKCLDGLRELRSSQGNLEKTTGQA